MGQTYTNNNPAVSVLLPVFNGGEYLKKSLQSVLAQDFTDFELLIIDDCSTDGSMQYLQGLDDKRISLFINERNKGLFYNLNFLVRKSKSALIKLWAQDDIMHSHCLESFVKFYSQNPHVGFIYSQRDIIDEAGKIKDLGIVDNTPAIVSPNLHAGISYFIGSIAGNISSVCISRKVLDEVGLFNEQMKISADFDMWVRLARNHDAGFINDHLLQLRDHSGQLSRNESLYILHLKEDLEVYRYLDSYMPPHLKREGKKLMRYHKLVFYYTLMVKAFLKGHIYTAYLFYKDLSAYDNFLRMSVSFLHAKMGKSIPNNYLEKFKE